MLGHQPSSKTILCPCQSQQKLRITHAALALLPEEDGIITNRKDAPLCCQAPKRNSIQNQTVGPQVTICSFGHPHLLKAGNLSWSVIPTLTLMSLNYLALAGLGRPLLLNLPPETHSAKGKIEAWLSESGHAGCQRDPDLGPWRKEVEGHLGSGRGWRALEKRRKTPGF